MPSPLPLIAIIGRPNVGKSTLFNRLIGQRRSIVSDEPGITRDRIYGTVSWHGRTYEIVDTGGIVTAAGVSAGIDMALHLVARLHSVERAREVRRYIQYDPQPPY